MTDESESLRKKAAELLERAAHRNTPLSPEEDAEVLTLLKLAQELEIRDPHENRVHRVLRQAYLPFRAPSPAVP